MHFLTQDENRIPVTDYDPNGHPPCCADFKCSARVKVIPEARENGVTTRRAYVSSINRDDHRDGCTELAKENDLYEESLSLKQATLSGRHIILPLNDLFGLPPEMWVNHAPTKKNEKPATALQAFKDSLRKDCNGEKGHSSHSIKSAKDMVSHLTRIHEHGHDAALEKTHITWQDKTLSFDNFYPDTEEKQVELFRELRLRSKCGNDFMCAAHGKDASARDVPRLIRFKPSQRTRENSMGRIQSTAITLDKEHAITKVPLILQHQLNFSRAEEVIDRKQFERDVFILATPQVVSTRVYPALEEFHYKTPKKAIFVYMNWDITHASQIIPAKGIKLPKPYRGNAPRMI